MKEFINELANDSIELLKRLIATQSFSREESRTADLIQEFFSERNIPFSRLENNIWSRNQSFNKELPTILLNSHHDTVKPNISWTKNPFEPLLEDGDKLYGLGSNDAGGPLVSLLATYLYFYYRTDLPVNIIFAATAEEEISGKDGIELLLPKLPEISFGIVGEPTQMHLAVAEKGLLVLDCVSLGISGHAAREEGENAIYNAVKDIQWFSIFRFPKVSETLGQVKMSVTGINAGTQHNVVPDRCEFMVDVRVTDAYSLNETLEIIRKNVSCEVKPRTVRLQPSGISSEHPLVRSAVELGRTLYGSPTLSDQALMPFETVKIGPGDSARSHTADEHIFISEIQHGVKLYIKLLKKTFSKF
jgi:acetylornithine deacetylase